MDTLFILLAIGNVLRSSLGISIRHSPAVYRESLQHLDEWQASVAIENLCSTRSLSRVFAARFIESPAVYRESVSRIFAVRGIRLCGIRHSPTNASNSRECKQLLECKNVKGSTTYRQCARQTVDDSITPALCCSIYLNSFLNSLMHCIYSSYSILGCSL